MKHNFVQTANIERFLAASGALDNRGAPEACILLVDGVPGLGKSHAGKWWAAQKGAVLIRVKAAATPHWVLNDLVKELGEQAPAYSCENLFAQAVGSLAKSPRPIVVDEVEAALHDMRTIETLRDLSDLLEVPLIFIGREFVYGRLQRYKQFTTRIGARTTFAPATLEDATKCFADLCECPVEPAVVAAVHKMSEGHIREIVKAIKNVERIGLRNKGKKVALADIAGKSLCAEVHKAAGHKAA